MWLGEESAVWWVRVYCVVLGGCAACVTGVYATTCATGALFKLQLIAVQDLAVPLLYCRPLYILFVQAKGYSEAIGMCSMPHVLCALATQCGSACYCCVADPSLVVSIVGEAEEAESFVLSQSVTVEEDSDGEQETAAEGEESERVGSGATYVHIVEKVE